MKISMMQSSSTNFRLKVWHFIEKRPLHICFPRNFADILRTPILWNANRLLLRNIFQKTKIAALDKFSEAAICRYLPKWVYSMHATQGLLQLLFTFWNLSSLLHKLTYRFWICVYFYAHFLSSLTTIFLVGLHTSLFLADFQC